jgi:peptide methionine sulfoxide reductase MsrA
MAASCTPTRLRMDWQRRLPEDDRSGTRRVLTPRVFGGSTFTEDYHQQYLAKNPNGYCGIGGCGVPFKLAELQVGEKA